MNPSTEIELDVPRSVGEIVDLVARCHARHLFLFLVLALSVVAPYTLIVVAVTGASPLGDSSASTSTIVVLVLIGFALVGPLVSVLHIQALSLMSEGIQPTFAEVYRRAGPVIAVAAAAEIVAGLGIAAGFVLFIVPGVILAIRLSVVAQDAAIARTDWMGAVRGSFELTRGVGLHVFAVVLVGDVFDFAVNAAGGAIAGTHTHAPQVILAIVVGTIAQSFSALITAVLYFDLRARAGY